MKYLIVLSLVFFSLTNFQIQAQTDRDQMEIKVDGLGCPFCAYGLEKKFKEFKGIDDVNIEMETGIFTFTYPTEDGLTIEQIENKVDAAGYTPVSTKITRADGSSENSEINQTELNEASKVVSVSFFVAGNCGMCKARIEKATKSIEGVTEASWNKETKQLSVSFDQSQISQESIEGVIAKVGHDTKEMKAEEEVYNNLPGCCQYER